MSVTPDFVGQVYKDTNTGNIWRANSLTPGDWTLEVQNTNLFLSPNSVKSGELLGFSLYTGGGVTSIVYKGTVSIGSFSIESFANTLRSFSAPLLTGIDPSQLQAGGLDLSGNPNLNTVSLPALTFIASQCFLNDNDITSLDIHSLAHVGGPMKLDGNANLVTLDMSSITTISGNVTAVNCTSLTNVICPLWVPTNSKTITFYGCNLDATSVNLILARCVANAGKVSGTINLSNGTSAAPTGQGIIDKATLNGRLAGLAVTN